MKMTQQNQEQEIKETQIGLGIDYGLVFKVGDIKTQSAYLTLDGKTPTHIIQGVGPVFFDRDSNELYYTSRNSLFKFPNKLIHD